MNDLLLIDILKNVILDNGGTNIIVADQHGEILAKTKMTIKHRTKDLAFQHLLNEKTDGITVVDGALTIYLEEVKSQIKKADHA